MVLKTSPNSFRSHDGFTLIELMVVVAIIAIIAAVAVPLLLKQIENKGEEAEEANSIVETPDTNQPTPFVIPEKAVIPVTESAQIHIALETRHKLQGLEVFTKYSSVFKSTFVFRNENKEADKIALEFPFPAEATEARSVSLRQILEDEYVELDNVLYTKKGIYWIGELPYDETITLQVNYEAQGHDRFTYKIPGTGRAESVKIAMDINGVTSEYVPEYALQPTLVEPGHIEWNLKNLVTDREVVLELPAATSPVGRIIFLSRLVGLAVLLFGAGFWYLGEGYKPYMLTSFRWAHFLLLALNYSLFFGVFAVLATRFEDPRIPILVAAGLSLPLLMLHVSRIIDFKFALTRVFPFAIFTLFLVFTGVYGGDFRDYLFTGATVSLFAYVTFTYRSWSAGREAVSKERQKKWARMAPEAEVQEALDGYTELCKSVSVEVSVSVELPGQDEKDQEVAKNTLLELEGARKSISEKLEEEEIFKDQFKLFKELEEQEEHKQACKELVKKIERSKAELVNFRHQLHVNYRDLKNLQRQRALQKQLVSKTLYCIACGHSGEDTPHCPQCGIPRPEKLICNSCGKKFFLPLHILSKKRSVTPLFCVRCGSEHKLLPGAFGRVEYEHQRRDLEEIEESEV